MKKALVLAVIPAVVIAGAATSAASTDAPMTHILVLHTHTTAFAQLDTGQVGQSPGDSSFRKEDLINPQGQQVGTMNTSCTTGVPADATVEVDMQCTGVLTLDGVGQIDWQGVQHLVAPPPPPAGTRALAAASLDPFFPTLAVVGGTGAYRFARGEIHQQRFADVDRTLRIVLS